jgi:photosystem II stability/assembly factor-like uncharacterized protein
LSILRAVSMLLSITAMFFTTSIAANPSATSANASEQANLSPKHPPAQQIQTRLVDFQLVDSNSGYTWGETHGSLRMYRTDDLGKTWVNVSPPANIKFGNIPRYKQDIFFYDKQHGWVVREVVGQEPAVLLSTKTGGKSWKSSPLPPFIQVVAIDFVNPQTGWLLSSSNAGAGSSEKSLYTTHDGGTTWKKIMQNEFIDDPSKATKQAIPRGGMVKGMTFRDERNGWVPVEAPVDKPRIYRTKDGGHTWGLVSLAVDKGCTYTTASEPVFFGRDKKSGWFPLRCEKGNAPHIYGYFTTDGGEHWTGVAFPIVPVEEFPFDKQIVFVNNQEGWQLGKGKMYHTIDGGKRWLPLGDDKVLSGMLKSYPQLAEMQFISSKVGWLLLEAADQKSSRLLQTTDGGKSWRVL